MRQFFSIIAICMVLVLVFPPVPSFAMDIDNFCIRAQSTTSSDMPYGQVVLQDITANEGYREQVLECLKTFDMSLLNDYDYYAILASRSSGTTADGTYSLYVICFNSDVEPYIVNCNSSVGSFTNQRIFAKLNETFYLCSASYTASSHTSFDNILYSNSFSNSYFYGGSSGEYGYANFQWLTYDANFPVYYVNEVKSISGFSDDRMWGWTTYAENRASLTDLFADAEGYNLQGEVVAPSNPDGVIIESNENHMYLKSIDAGFCKPYSLENLSSAGGGYIYLKYTFDDWVNNHSGQYSLEISTQIDVDGTFYSGVITRSLDLQGVSVVAFNDLTAVDGWIDNGFLFVEFSEKLNDSYNKGYTYSIPYPVFCSVDSSGVSNRSRFLGNGRNRLFLTSGGRGYNITSYDLGSNLESIFDIVSHKIFSIQLNVKLIDDQGNESGRFAKSFNLLTGVSTTHDTSATNNDNPFEPDLDNPIVPDGTGSDSSQLAPIFNNSYIFSTIGFDPGYTDLKNDLNANPDGNFTQYLNPLKADEGQSWFFSFVNQMPPEMKSILVTGAGVGVLFGIFRFIRRG